MKKGLVKIILINTITMIRLVGSFFVPYVFNTYGYQIVAIFCICLFLTDSIDGFLARKTNSCTFFGSLMDAFSDKFLAIISLSIIYTINPIILILIILEIFIAIVNILSYFFNGNAQTSKIGKIKTILMGITIGASLIFIMSLGVTSLTITIIKYISLITMILSLITLVNYVHRMIISFKNRKKIKKETLVLKSFKQFTSDLFNTEYFRLFKNKSYVYLFYLVK